MSSQYLYTNLHIYTTYKFDPSFQGNLYFHKFVALEQFTFVIYTNSSSFCFWLIMINPIVDNLCSSFYKLSKQNIWLHISSYLSSH